MSKVVFEPMPGKIAVRREQEDEMTRAGLIIPAPYRNKSQFGTVVAIYQPFLYDHKDQVETEAYVKVGDTVIFGQHSGTEVTVDGVTVTILKESEILTKFRIKEEAQDAEHKGPAGQSIP